MWCVTACVRSRREDALDVHEAEPNGPGAPLPAPMLASCLQTLRHGRDWRMGVRGLGMQPVREGVRPREDSLRSRFALGANLDTSPSSRLIAHLEAEAAGRGCSESVCEEGAADAGGRNALLNAPQRCFLLPPFLSWNRNAFTARWQAASFIPNRSFYLCLRFTRLTESHATSTLPRGLSFCINTDAACHIKASDCKSLTCVVDSLQRAPHSLKPIKLTGRYKSKTVLKCH